MIARPLLAFVVGVGLAACGGKKPPPPSNTGDTTTSTPAPAGDALDATGKCCCELASDPPSYELQDPTLCHEDSHGVCAENLTMCADSGTGGP